MPRFSVSEQDIAALVALFTTRRSSPAKKAGVAGVDVADLQSGSVEGGKQYFNGAGKCSSCHSPTGDLAGIASRFQGLKLEERMLYPRGAKPKVTVTIRLRARLISGELAYLDEFTVGMRDATGRYHSGPQARSKYGGRAGSGSRQTCWQSIRTTTFTT